MKIINKKDDTIFGYDETEDGRRVWYYIRVDIFGNGKTLAIWNPDNRLRCFKSFKKALLNQAIANEDKIADSTVAYVAR